MIRNWSTTLPVVVVPLSQALRQGVVEQMTRVQLKARERAAEKEVVAVKAS